MRIRIMRAGAAVLFAAGMAAGPLRAAATGGETTGELALQMAGVAGMALPESGAKQAALQALRRSGIDLGSDPKARVTQGTLVRIGRSLGVAVASSRPGAGVTPGMGRAFLQTVTGPLRTAAATTAGGTPIIHASCKGRESRQQRKGIPASPADINAIAEPCEEPIP
jgi:hypothetical protein